MAKDPICGMEVDPVKARYTSSFGGKSYYFCSPGCKSTFEKNPAEFAK